MTINLTSFLCNDSDIDLVKGSPMPQVCVEIKPVLLLVVVYHKAPTAGP